MLVCQITDLRVKPRGALAYRVVDTAAYLRSCIAHILAQPQRPDVVVATGDLTDSAVAATSPSPAQPGRARPRARCRIAIPARAARLPPRLVARELGRGDPYGVHRRLRRALPVPLGRGPGRLTPPFRF